MSDLMVLSQAKKLAENLSIEGDAKELIDTLKATAFKVKDGVVSDAQMTALMIVAQQYGLNPFVREIFAYPDKQNGIVPVVSVDGWIKIITTHPEYDGMEFTYSDEIVTMPKAKPCPAYVECTIYRKDKSRPTVIREYLDESYKETQYSSPWQTHTKRFLRHRALIQCGRVAFGLSGIYEPDEADNINNGEKIINPLPTEQSAPKTFDSLLKSIGTMQVEDFKSIDITKFNAQEKALIKAACKARKQQILDSQVVSTQYQNDYPNWAQMIEDAASSEELMALYSSMPPHIKEEFATDIDLKSSCFMTA